MRGFEGCGFGPFGHHDMGPFGHHGADRYGCGPPRHFGPPGHLFGPSGPCRRFGHECCRRERPFFGQGPHWEGSISCQDCSGYGGPGFGRGPCAADGGRPRGGCGPEHDPRGPPPFGPGRRFGPHFGPDGPLDPPQCGPRDHDRERSPRRRHRSPGHGGPFGPHGPHEDLRHHSRHGRCQGPCRRQGGDESGPERRHGHGFGPFGPHFGHHHPIGPWNRRGNERCCDSGEESDNEKGGKKNRSCHKKNKDQNREETVLVQRITVEKEPRSNSV